MEKYKVNDILCIERKIIVRKRRFFSMKKSYLLYCLSIIAFIPFACKKPDITPAYLILSDKDFIDSVCVNVSNFNTEHDTHYEKEELEIIRQHSFKDVWVSFNGHATYWQLPCTIPVLPDYSKKNNVRIIPCVRTANTTLTTLQYHFLNPVDFDITLEKEEKRVISPGKFEYRKEVNFPLLETFSQSTDFASLDTLEGANIEIYVDNEHKSMGRILLNNTSKYFDIGTPYMNLDGHGVRHFWEIYYKSEGGEMFTRLQFRNTVTGAVKQDMVNFPATKGVWKKGYIDITEWVSMACGTASKISVSLCIRGIRNKNVENAEFYLGHVKLISMEARY